jgi:hypothetical protein
MNFLSRISKAIGDIVEAVSRPFRGPASPAFSEDEDGPILVPTEPVRLDYDFEPRELPDGFEDRELGEDGLDIADTRFMGHASIADFNNEELRPVQTAYLSDVVNYYGDIPVPVEFYYDDDTSLYFVVVLGSI